MKLWPSFRPSSFERVRLCAGSARLERKYGRDRQTAAATKGSAQHEDARAILKEEATLHEADPEVQDYVAYIELCHELFGGRLWIEETFQYRADGNLIFEGTPDCVHLDDSGGLHIHDKKFRHGKTVSPVENTQMSCYALAIVRSGIIPEPSSIMFHIHQRGVDTWGAPPGYLARFERDLRDWIVKAEAKDAKRYPSEQACRYCSAQAFCPELQAYIKEHIQASPSIPALAEAYSMCDMAITWVENVKAQALGHLQAGGKLPGYKLVKKLAAPLRWIDAGNAEEYFDAKYTLDDIFNRKLRTPSQMLNILPNEMIMIQELSTRPESKPVIAKEDDKRPAIEVPKFENLEPETDEE